eukprot:gene29-12841_t
MPPKRGSIKARGSKPASGTKRAKPDEPADDYFLGDDDDNGPRGMDEPEVEEAAETAEERRLRLVDLGGDDGGDRGRRMGVTGGSDEDDDNEDGVGGDRLAARLQQDAAEASGKVQRKLAHCIEIPSPAALGEGRKAGSCNRGHRLSATAVALMPDDSAAFTVSKDGGIIKWDLETMQKTRLFRPGDRNAPAKATGPEWVKKGPRQASKNGLYATAVSSDGKFMAVGGGDRKVHLFDARNGGHIQSFPGHKDAVSALAFREGSHQLFSGSLDRTVKMWSIDDRAYMDTLFGHQAEVLCLDVLRQERAVTGANDRTCRMWKVPEESQLLAPSMSVEGIRFISNTEWLSGGSDSSLQLWSHMKKKPVAVIRNAHGAKATTAYGGISAGCAPLSGVVVRDGMALGSKKNTVPGVVVRDGMALGSMKNTVPDSEICDEQPDVSGWVQSVAVCRGTDLVASGAGDGCVRLWSVAHSKSGGVQGLNCLGGVPARGFVNGLALSRTGSFFVAAIGQEPRMGRWLRDSSARNGLLLQKLTVKE